MQARLPNGKWGLLRECQTDRYARMKAAEPAAIEAFRVEVNEMLALVQAARR